jgi:hypothetical protein
MSQKFFVITTIHNPTEAIYKYRDALLKEGWKIVIVGDKKTPENFHIENIDYLSLDRQYQLFKDLAYIVPVNHYARKNLGYLYAIQQGAEIIAESDDDNLPTSNYPNFYPAHVRVPVLECQEPVNVYSYFTEKHVWPRGLPLDKVKNYIHPNLLKEKDVNCYIQQGLVDLDPDVDAIYRLTVPHTQNIQFTPNKCIALSKGCYSPFNTQNTLFYKKVFPFMLLPISVHSRVTDIWRGYIAQRLLWELDSSLLFLSPTVYQLRNQHNLVKDFQEELPLYTKVHDLIELLNKYQSTNLNPCQMLLNMYEYLFQHEFFNELEVQFSRTWIQEVSKYI